MPGGPGTHTVMIMALAAVVIGCGVDAPEPVITTVSDSAGVRLVQHDLSGVELPAWRTLAMHDLQVGGNGGTGATAFSSIEDITVAPDGRILVSDRDAAEVRVYSASGIWERTLGGAGDETVNFESPPAFAGLARDTLYAFDPSQGSVTPVHLDGGGGEPLSLIAIGIDRPGVVLRRSDGSYVVQSPWVVAGPAGAYGPRLEQDSVVITTAAQDGSRVDSLTVLPDMYWGRSVESIPDGRVRVRQANPPYSPRAFLLTDGVLTTVAHSAEFDFSVHDERGRVVDRIRVTGVRHPATRHDIRQEQEARLRADLGDDIPESARRLFVDFAPEQLPAFADARYSEAGDLWVALQDLGETEGTDWVVLSSDGTLRGSVHTPGTLTPRYISDEYLVGVVVDAVEGPMVRRYALISPPGEPDQP